jgi:hypothetical protein
MLESIENPVVRRVVGAYMADYIYPCGIPNEPPIAERVFRVCSCETIQARKQAGEDISDYACNVHIWRQMRTLLQMDLINEGLSRPLGGLITTAKPEQKFTAIIMEAKQSLFVNPVLNEPYYKVLTVTNDLYGTALLIAQGLSKPHPLVSTGGVKGEGLEHIVSYMTHSDILDMRLARQESVVEALRWLPVLVYVNNRDNRFGNGWVSGVVNNRSYGITFVLQEP